MLLEIKPCTCMRAHTLCKYVCAYLRTQKPPPSSYTLTRQYLINVGPLIAPPLLKNYLLIPCLYLNLKCFLMVSQPAAFIDNNSFMAQVSTPWAAIQPISPS